MPTTRSSSSSPHMMWERAIREEHRLPLDADQNHVSQQQQLQQTQQSFGSHDNHLNNNSSHHYPPREQQQEQQVSYEEIMGMPIRTGGAENSISNNSNTNHGVASLSSRLETFRKWLAEDAKIVVHPSLCVVNGEATDGTKNAPVLVFEQQPTTITTSSSTASSAIAVATGSSSGNAIVPSSSTSAALSSSSSNARDGGRIGLVDSDVDRVLYDRTMGCQIRAAREIKKDEVVMTVPISAMITPDLVAASDAGRVIAACCQVQPQQQPLHKQEEGEMNHNTTVSFWDGFENTAQSENNYMQKVGRNSGTQLLVRILQERKRVENAFQKAMQQAVHNNNDDNNNDNNSNIRGTEWGNDIISTSDSNHNGQQKQQQQSYNLAPPGLISTRAPFLAFLIHQRFSNQLRPPVISNDDAYHHHDTEERATSLSINNTAYRIHPLPDSPNTFAPYARTLPSSVSLPICWKRNELALLAGCIPGTSPLQQVAARTVLLATEFMALLDAGILYRFPQTFPLGLITWERWVWAAAVFTSRTLPSSCCLQKGEDKVSSLTADRLGDFQSPPDIWDELGVMVPLLDMLNHESEANQITWQQYTPQSLNNDDVRDDSDNDDDDFAKSGPPIPRAVVHTRVKKGAQLYTCYGHLPNQDLILQYGFAQMGNPSDELGLGWGLADAVGDVPPPSEYVPPFDEHVMTMDGTKLVFESADKDAVNSWWKDERLSLLEKEAAQSCSDSFMSDLKMGKKMTCTAYSDGSLHPILLTAAVVATAPTLELTKRMSKSTEGDDDNKYGWTLTRSHQRILRSYLAFVFSRKLEKLLQNLSNGLKDHFSNLQLWTRVTQNGLQYSGDNASDMDSVYTGWQSFFDANAYASTMEVEKRYYSMAPVSCVLTLYDGHLKSLQATLNGLSTWEQYESGALRQLEDLGFIVLKEDDGGDLAEEVEEEQGNVSENNIEKGENGGSSKPESKEQESTSLPSEMKQRRKDGKQSPSKSRRRNRKRSSGEHHRPPALKLHVGNLSYTTTPSELYDYFAHVYGRENVLECHIPTERGTGKSRGFGFVTMPEFVARRATQSGRMHEIQGRLLKVAESNSVGSSNTGKGNTTNNSSNKPPPNIMAPAAGAQSDRCMNCGYSPKYCICDKPYGPGFGGRPGLPPRMDRYDRVDPYERDFYHYGPGGGSGRSHGDTYSRSYSPHRRGSLDDRDRDYRRDIDRDYRYSSKRSESRSESESRGRERGHSRSEKSKRKRSDSRSPPRRSSRNDLPSSKSWEHKHSKGSSRHSRSDSRDRGSRSRSRSYSNRREPRRTASVDESHGEAGRGGTKSRSPHADRFHAVASAATDNNIAASSSTSNKRRDSRRRSRSRSRDRKSSRKRNRKDSSRRHARSSSRSDSYSTTGDHE